MNILILAILLISISFAVLIFQQLIFGLKKEHYEKDLKIIHNELCCYHSGRMISYSLPFIRHTFYDNFVVINGKGENERIEYKYIVKAQISPIPLFSFGLLKCNIEYDYLDIANKERRSVILSTRYPEKISEILKNKAVATNI